MPSKNLTNLTEGPIGRKLLLFALPILAGNVAQALNNSINAIWIGRYLGETALTGAVNANNVIFLLLGSIFGMSMVTTIMIAQSIGANKVEQARKIAGTSATFFLSLAIAVATIGYFIAHPLLVIMNTPQDSLVAGATYLQITFIAIPFAFFFTFLVAAMRGTGDSRTPFLFLLLSIILDVIFNPLLIFGLGPFPKLGIAGSAWGSLIAQAISLSALLLYMRRSNHILWIDKNNIQLLLISRSIVKTIILKGIPMGLQMILISLSMIALISMVNRYGSTTSAAYGATLQLWAYVQMPAMAIGAACSSFAAQNIGAKKWDRISKATYYGVGFNFLLTGALSLIIVLLDRWTLAAFLPDDSEAWNIARHLNHISIWSFMFFGVSFVISGIVRSTGAVIPPLLILGFSLWGIRVPFAFALQPYLGVDAIWWSFPISAACSMIISIAYYWWGNWRQTKILPQT